MKKTRWAAAAAALIAVAVLAAGCAPAELPENAIVQLQDTAEPKVIPQVETHRLDMCGFGAMGALEDTEYSLAEMLIYALQDEYLAHQVYVQTIEAFGEQTPFSNIVKAEEVHIAELLPLFETYGLDVPEDNSAEYALLPGSILEAGQMGVLAETNNIAMYETFLNHQLPDDVRLVFEELKAASEQHLEAFLRVADREWDSLGGGQHGQGHGGGGGGLGGSGEYDDDEDEFDDDAIDT